MASLQEQLLKAGIADKKQAIKAEKDKRKQAAERKAQTKQLGKKKAKLASVAERQAEEAANRKILADKAERDRQLNMQKNEVAAAKALRAQIIQLVDMNRIKTGDSTTPYQFTDGKQIKKIHVTPKLVNELERGLLAIAKLGENYSLVPAAVADKIKQRDESVIVSHHLKKANEVAADDPYADYEIPDDFDW